MSIIFGLLRERGGYDTEFELWRLAAATKPYGTGPGNVYVRGRVGMGLQPYVSHERSAIEDRPVTDSLGNTVCFDGRLDNYSELAVLLGMSSTRTSDSALVLESFSHWGEECFARFTGDWALALWSIKDNSLYFARDHAGTRTLYYSQHPLGILWSTYLDTFVACRPKLGLSRDYAACYLANYPIRDLTPYEGIHSVLPAHYVVVRDGKISQRAHWSPVVRDSISLRTDSEYEENFFALFRQSVVRRTGAGAPVLAQLSGGMDSTSIVCMSDDVKRSSGCGEEILDTVSFFDDSEATYDERSYFAITEGRRGKVGTHIKTSFSQHSFEPLDPTRGTYLIPGADSSSFEQEKVLHEAIWQRGYRSILSGIGGDEVLGGVPVPFPELANYLVSGNVRGLLRQSLAWSLVDRSPLMGMLFNTAAYTVRLYANTKPRDPNVAPWVSEDLRRRVREIDDANNLPNSRIGIGPHRIDNAEAWWSIMETLPHLSPQILFRPEYRYPFLDKDLVQYLFSIPRDQILRPGRRRSLMRRALRNIVPEEVLERRRKAFQLRAPLHALQQASSTLALLFVDSKIGKFGFVDPGGIRRALVSVQRGDLEQWPAFLRAVAFELWLRARSTETHHCPSAEARDVHSSLTA